MRSKIAYGFGLVIVTGLILFFIWPPLLFDLVGSCFSGDSYWLKGDIRQLSRRNEKLPTVSIENGNTVYCRMAACDFRFPLPNGSHVTMIDLSEGGFDTVNGTVNVVATNGASINLDSYTKQIDNYHLEEGGNVQFSEITNHTIEIRFSYFGDY
jgi:hypothetical protein